MAQGTKWEGGEVDQIFPVSIGLLCYRVLPLPPAQTIGYGSRSPLPGCPDGILVTILHIFLTTLLATLFSGSFLAKFAK